MKKESINKIIIVTIFAIVMAFLESAVVIYLRKLFYPQGFNFPLRGFIEPNILGIEWIRESATIIMLITIGLLAGKKAYEKFAYFIYAFAIWDIFYYVFLKVLLGWPSSFLTWDLLFLIPWPWIGPILSPILCSILMVITAILIISLEDLNIKVKINAKELALVILGIILVLFTWLFDYGKIIITGNFLKNFLTLTNNEQFSQVISAYSPTYYNWPVFLIGFIISSIGICLFYIRNKKKIKN